MFVPRNVEMKHGMIFRCPSLMIQLFHSLMEKRQAISHRRCLSPMHAGAIPTWAREYSHTSSSYSGPPARKSRTESGDAELRLGIDSKLCRE